MTKVLIIGCGNIGALYDIETNQVNTHLKAYYNKGYEIFIYDINHTLLNSLKCIYKSINIIYKLENLDKFNFDCVSICTPTKTHTELLKMLMSINVPNILCEKPIGFNIDEIKETMELYLKSKTKILVNYIRRFQDSYLFLKNFIHDNLLTQNLITIDIKYNKGFLNNCSHAFDLVSFLLNKNINISNINIFNVSYDYFDNDPTISLNGMIDNSLINILGLVDISYSVFEIELFFKDIRIQILDSGKTIKILNKNININDKYPENLCLNNYMSNVINHLDNMIRNIVINDNFISSVEVNKSMLKILEKIK